MKTNITSLQHTYQKLVITQSLAHDQVQIVAILQLCQLSTQLEKYADLRKRYLSNFRPPIKPQSLYLQDRVGCGKTMLMDFFYRELAV